MAVTPMDRAGLRAAAAEAGFRFRPGTALWQHFLHATPAVNDFVKVAGIQSGDHVLEVGAGLGSVTLALLGQQVSVCAVDVDPALARQLPRTVATRAFRAISRLTVLHADAMTLPRSDLTGEPTVLVASLPPSVAVSALRHLMAEFPSLRTAVIQTDAATANQIAAQPESPHYAAASVQAAFFGTARCCAPTSPTAFWPVLRTHAGVVRLDRHEHVGWPTDTAFRSEVFALIEHAFTPRHRTASSAFAAWAGSRKEAAHRLLTASILPSRAADTLTIADYTRLLASSSRVDHRLRN